MASSNQNTMIRLIVGGGIALPGSDGRKQLRSATCRSPAFLAPDGSILLRSRVIVVTKLPGCSEVPLMVFQHKQEFASGCQSIRAWDNPRQCWTKG
ncbi:MAG TPA: hypothetical protein DCF63_13310 [Planctomycetaceae bacterium]|nr:hypothetical protein [Planctomycetaceae bacterium]